jgi:molybdenum cofactor cytidylyltransferase
LAGFVSALVLAAGRGARMGRTKQLLLLDGRPLLLHVVATALRSHVDEVVVVLGHEAHEVQRALGPVDGARVAINPDYASGQASSLRAGLNALDRRSQAAVVLLGDQPNVTVEDIDRVVGEYRASGKLAARATYDSEDGPVAGHPTVIGRALWPELQALTGDTGARAVLCLHDREVLQVAMGKPPPPDIDTPADYERSIDPSS